LPNVRQQITQGSKARGLDPRAVLAVAAQEGLGGGIGDAGTSFGPFQLHVGGALPRGRGNAWANSPEGINYALDRIASVAKGKHGAAAINAIVRQFERPANPDREASRALASYGKVGGGAAGAPPLAPRPPGLTAAPDKNFLMQQLIGELGHRQPDIANLAGIMQQERQVHPPPHPVDVMGPPAPAPKTGKGTINELFYDPLGGIKHDHSIGAIGGHTNHVHVALGSAEAQRSAIAQARRMGLHVGEENTSDVHQVHAKNSYHYHILDPKTGLRGAADVSGNPKAMAAFYRWVAANYG
jgi:hypothetical protein